MLSLYVAVYTLEATLVIAVLIYSLQTGAADREARRRARSAGASYTRSSPRVWTPWSASPAAETAACCRSCF